MKTYKLTLRGTKKNNTQDLTVFLKAENKGQAFNFAYGFFQTGEYNSSTEWESKFGICRVIDFIPSAKELDNLAGKYKVHHTSLHVF